MMRSLWTAASGMRAQQTNVDTISNNLANVNTVGYKKESVEFKSLLYQTIQAKTTSANGDTKPVGAQVGLGVKNSSITSIFKQGNITQTESSTDFAIQGNGFFMVQDLDGEIRYTRNGSFNWATSSNGVMLANAEGLPVLDTNGSPIEFDAEEFDMTKVTVDTDGQVCYPDETGNPQELGIQIGLVQFVNPAGLLKEGGSLYKVTEASGEPIYEIDGVVQKSIIKQNYIERSNVQVVDEMVNLIVAQRAYEMNSKAITTSDEMLSQANQLKR
ncbi:MAG: flagellar basal-body rod protein FlgG [Lachnospiraceae bacterium]|nr:flagellar basal-body rod protein FlgG [Lachnospiraceae bacterium]